MLKNTSNEIIKFECVECFESVEIIPELITSKEEIMQREELCEKCFNENYFYCEECEEYHEYATTDYEEVEFWAEYKKICLNCIEYNDDRYYYCGDCGKYKYSGDYEGYVIYDVDDGEYVRLCEDCKDDNSYVFWCEYHERWERAYNSFDIRWEGLICSDAYENSGNYDYCPECDQYYNTSDMTYSDAHGCNYCDNCYEYIDNGCIKDYHDHKMHYINNTKIKDTVNNSLTFGFELEVEAGNYTTCGDMSQILYDNMDGFTVYESDGSLDNGFEIISVPYDIEFYKESGQDLINNMLDLLVKNKFKSHDTTTCGLHVHVGRQGLGNTFKERHDNVLKVACIIEYFKPQLTLFSRRKEGQLNRWCKFVTSGIDKEELTKEKIINIVEDNKGRYNALNLNNEPTIEFRLFRGTLKKESFLATLELVNNICKYCKENEIDSLQELNFYDIATYDLNEYVGQYLQDKNIINKVMA